MFRFVLSPKLESRRAGFPFLQLGIGNFNGLPYIESMKRIYLDHAATTPVDPAVLEAMLPYFSGVFGNASSVHSYGREARSALENARAVVASAIGARPGEVLFTSGGTESDNLALRGCALALAGTGRRGIVTSAAEHHAVLDTCESLAKEGFDVRILPVDENALVSPGRLSDEIGETTGLVSVMIANNEVGSIAPVRDIADACHAVGALFHSDAVQGFGRLPVHVDECGADLLTLSAHKIYGPKGIGALYVRKGTEIEPLFRGGGQERGRRPGTETVALAVGFARAVEMALATMAGESERLRKLRDDLQRKITFGFPEVIVNGHPEKRLPHILNISFDSSRIELEGEMLLMNMDLRGIALTSGSACTSGSMQPSHVLLAMGRDARTARASLRFAFGKSNSEEDVDTVVEELRAVLAVMKGGR
jgi:cysteine desulfurase